MCENIIGRGGDRRGRDEGNGVLGVRKGKSAVELKYHWTRKRWKESEGKWKKRKRMGWKE